MKFSQFTSRQRLLLLHAMEDHLHNLAWRASQPVEPGRWEQSNTLLQQSLQKDCDDLRELVAELKDEIIQSEKND